ncbi:Uncharacterised protein [Mycobacterium tuberculosis]|nr:Uncharacterised protein [Mycobacterium tuberculosis]
MGNSSNTRLHLRIPFLLTCLIRRLTYSEITAPYM